MTTPQLLMEKHVPLKICIFLLFPFLAFAQAEENSLRHTELLNGSRWQFIGAGAADALPEIGSPAFKQAAWKDVSIPHIFQTRAAYDTLTKGWYRRRLTIDPSAKGEELYLVFEGAASIADVYVNGQHLGQHRGAYTRFIFDATQAVHSGSDNELAIRVDDTPDNTLDCLPISKTGLYKVWGGLYRNVWLLETAPVHIDPTDYASPGVYLTPKDVTKDSATLNIRALLQNTSGNNVHALVRFRILDPMGKEISSASKLSAPAEIPANGRSSVELSTVIDHPQLWQALHAAVYHVETTVSVDGKDMDEVTQPTGFRWLEWDWTDGTVKLNGQRIILYGVDLHQETEAAGSAVSPNDLKANFAVMQDLGNNFVRLPHYPHASLEYDLADQDGILCWAENGHSNRKDIVSPTAAQITTEMVKQNYNHPSIVFWSMGNESNAAVADECVPVAKALDSTRPVVVANMASTLADFHTAHSYQGWYGPSMTGFKPKGFMTEVGIGGVVTTHCDYDKANWQTNKYEPEEYQQIGAEYHFQQAFHGDDSHLGLFCWWILRDFSDEKYKAPVGWNTKGLETYSQSKKDIYYLYRDFLRPNTPSVWITSKRYFLRQGSVENGIKVYSNAPSVSLILNGQKISTLPNGKYVIPDGPWSLKVEKPRKDKDGNLRPAPTPKPYTAEKVDNVFYWPVPMRTGKNIVTASDEQGHSDTATIYFYGEKGAPELPVASPLIKDLTSSNPQNKAYYMDMPVQAQWPVYYDLDSTADNSLNTIPASVEGATWIALRRVTKPEQVTDVSFTLNRPATVSVLCTKADTAPAWLVSAGFTQTTTDPIDWRNNDLQLIPAELYSRHFAAGETVKLSMGERDALILLK